MPTFLPFAVVGGALLLMALGGHVRTALGGASTAPEAAYGSPLLGVGGGGGEPAAQLQAIIAANTSVGGTAGGQLFIGPAQTVGATTASAPPPPPTPQITAPPATVTNFGTGTLRTGNWQPAPAAPQNPVSELTRPTGATPSVAKAAPAGPTVQVIGGATLVTPGPYTGQGPTSLVQPRRTAPPIPSVSGSKDTGSGPSSVVAPRRTAPPVVVKPKPKAPPAPTSAAAKAAGRPIAF